MIQPPTLPIPYSWYNHPPCPFPTHDTTTHPTHSLPKIQLLALPIPYPRYSYLPYPFPTHDTTTHPAHSLPMIQPPILLIPYPWCGPFLTNDKPPTHSLLHINKHLITKLILEKNHLTQALCVCLCVLFTFFFFSLFFSLLFKLEKSKSEKCHCLKS